VAIQALVLNILGISVLTDADAYSKVRVGWISQPAWKRDQDICSIRTGETDDPINRIRDRKVLTNDSTTILLRDTYIRVWTAMLTFYGPNGFDNARLVKSAMNHTWTQEQLGAVGLSWIPEARATTRAPELFEGQWWDRSDLSLSFNELVTETLTVASSIASAEALLYSQHGLEADITAQG
jgi:hypothetical protein